MAPAANQRVAIAGFGRDRASAVEAARPSRAAWRHGHFAAKSAPQHRDFAAGKVEAS
jgi:hypothetical protein